MIEKPEPMWSEDDPHDPMPIFTPPKPKKKKRLGYQPLLKRGGLVRTLPTKESTLVFKTQHIEKRLLTYREGSRNFVEVSYHCPVLGNITHTKEVFKDHNVHSKFKDFSDKSGVSFMIENIVDFLIDEIEEKHKKSISRLSHHKKFALHKKLIDAFPSMSFEDYTGHRIKMTDDVWKCYQTLQTMPSFEPLQNLFSCFSECIDFQKIRETVMTIDDNPSRQFLYFFNLLNPDEKTTLWGVFWQDISPEGKDFWI